MRFGITKTICYDVSTEIECEATSVEELRELIERDGDFWIVWDQSEVADERYYIEVISDLQD
jgi:hypothetical protein